MYKRCMHVLVLFLRINAISNARVIGDNYNEGIFGRRGARVWIFFGFLFAFGGLVGSLWIFIQQFIVPSMYVYVYVHVCTEYPS